MVNGPVPRRVSLMPARSMALPKVLNDPLAAAVSTRFLVLGVLVMVFISIEYLWSVIRGVAKSRAAEAVAPAGGRDARLSAEKGRGSAARLSGRYDIAS